MFKYISITLIGLGVILIAYTAYDATAYKDLPIPDRIRAQFSIGVGLIIAACMLLQLYYKKKNNK